MLTEQHQKSPVDALVSRKELYEMIRKQIEHEDTLINHRLNWLLAAQAFLFAAFISVIDSSNFSIPMKLDLGKIIYSLTIAIAGFCVGGISLIGILAAQDSLRNLREKWYKPRPNENETLKTIECFPQITWVGNDKGITTAKWFPIIVFFIWFILIGILVYSLFVP